MKCLSTIENTIYKPDLIKHMTDLYVFKGKDYYYENLFKKHVSKMVEDTVEKDVFYALKIMNVVVKDSRFKSIIKNGKPANTESEKIALNLKSIFEVIQQKAENVILDTNEFLHLATMIYKGFKDKTINYKKDKIIVQNNLLKEEKSISRRDSFEELLKLYNVLVNERNYEPIQSITRLYVDITKAELFDKHNEILTLIIMYCLIFSQRFMAFKYVSFFELYFNKMSTFNSALQMAYYRYEEGIPDPSILNQMIIDLMLEAYRIIDKMSYEQSFAFIKEFKLSKQDDVCSIIMKLNDNFTKEDVKKASPYVSESTISRALEQLKKEGKIRSNGTGRSATWTKISTEFDYTKTLSQMDIYSFIDEG